MNAVTTSPAEQLRHLRWTLASIIKSLPAESVSPGRGSHSKNELYLQAESLLQQALEGKSGKAPNFKSIPNNNSQIFYFKQVLINYMLELQNPLYEQHDYLERYCEALLSQVREFIS